MILLSCKTFKYGALLMVMAEDVQETAKKRLKEGWIKAWAAIEVLAVTKDAAETSLKKHMEQMKKEGDALVYKEDFKKAEEVPHPFDRNKSAYSMVVEVEFAARKFETLVYLILNYAPSSVEILEPSEIRIKMGEAQGILNSLSELVHNLIASRQGAVAIDA